MKSAKDLHIKNTNWIKDLLFYQDEIRIFIELLQKNEEKNTDTQIKSEIMEYLTQLKNIGTQIKSIIEEVNNHEHYLYEMVEGTELEMSIIFPQGNDFAAKDMVDLKNHYQDLKKRLFPFLTQLI
nr:hypothetical protein [uncultured bacterium]